jgi:hypothetical protein
MAFETTVVEDQYQIRYNAQQAGDFALHLWTDSVAGGKRKLLPGSPFNVRVTGDKASASGSFIRGIEAYSDGPAEASDLIAGASAARKRHGSTEIPEMQVKASVVAGDKLQLFPQLRDEFGNASFASDQSPFVAFVEHLTGAESGTRNDVPLKQLRDLGKYEVTQELTKCGLHRLSILLDGQHVGQVPDKLPPGTVGSPVYILVCPAAPVANKSILKPPEEPPTQHSTCTLTLETFDKFGNRMNKGGATIAARTVGTGCSPITVVDGKDGTYSLSFSCSIVGECKVVVRLDNVEMPSLTVGFVKGEDLEKDFEKEKEPEKGKPGARGAKKKEISDI